MNAEPTWSTTGRTPLVTWMLVAVSSIVFITSRRDPSWVLAYLLGSHCTGWDACSPAYQDLARGEVWRLFTPSFVHFGTLHFFWNVMGQTWFGTVVERTDGHRQLLWIAIAMVALTALIANLGLLLAPGRPGVGGSGVTFGLLGYVLSRRWSDKGFRRATSPATDFVALALLVGSFRDMNLSIPNAVHLGGLVAGVAWGLARSLRRLGPETPVRAGNGADGRR